MGRRRRRIITTSADETSFFGKKLARFLPADVVICFFGDLGVGKTTLIKGFIAERSKVSELDVTSPTFTYLQSYGSVHHFDLYRLKCEDDFLALGFDEYLSKGCCCIEWSENIASLIPESAYRVTLTHLDETHRLIEVTHLTHFFPSLSEVT